MASEHVVALETKPEPSDMTTIVRGLAEFNASKAGGDTPDYLLITVRDGKGTVVGGLLGATYLGWLQVTALWVPEALRGTGLGKALLAEAEKEGLRRGCPRVFLETLSFQALPFYQKAGYKIFSTLPDFPPGGARYALTKELAEVAA